MEYLDNNPQRPSAIRAKLRLTLGDALQDGALRCGPFSPHTEQRPPPARPSSLRSLPFMKLVAGPPLYARTPVVVHNLIYSSPFPRRRLRWRCMFTQSLERANSPSLV